MKVKVGELKTHLSRYLHQLKKSGETIEVCARETPVAYITAANAYHAQEPASKDALELARQLSAAGIQWDHRESAKPTDAIMPTPAGDHREDIVTVKKIRAERDW
jgi:antitoxin (DNA-binding transcriptional repressor) of toxin-antitoxin stability system